MYDIKNLKELLSKEIGKDFEIIEKKTKTLTPPGEHYGSLMVSLDLIIQRNNVNEDVHLVAKFLPASEMLRNAFDTDVTFKKEIVAYTEILPALKKFQIDCGINDIIDVFPKCYGARLNLDTNQNEVGEDAVLIFENLKAENYVMYNRYDGFDFDTSNFIVKDLAKFHALTLAMKLLRPKEYQQVFSTCLVRNKGMENAPKELNDAFYDSVITVCKSIPEVSKYGEKLEKLFYESRNYFNADKNPRYYWGSLIHGDYWGNNTMVKYDENGKIVNNKILDLQIIEYDSVVHDLLFFLFTSVNNDVLNDNYDNLIKSYHNQFVDVLKRFNIDTKPYTWDEFVYEIENEIKKEAFHIFFMLKFIFAEKGKVKSLEEFQPSDWTRKDLIGEKHKEKLQLTILEFVKRNWL